MAEYCLLTLTLSLIIIEGFRANNVTDITFREQILELNLFLTYFS